MSRMATGPMPRFRYLCCDEVGPFRRWMWRPYCWVKRRHEPHHCDMYFETCVWCEKLLWSKRRDGSPNPIVRARYSTLRSPAAAVPTEPAGPQR